MVNIAATVAALADLLTAAGLPADADAGALVPPCAWIDPGTLDPEYLDGSGDLNLDVYLITADAGYTKSFAALETMLDAALTVLSPDGPVDLSAGVETSAGILPAFKIPLQVKVNA